MRPPRSPLAAPDGTITWTAFAASAGLDLVVPLRASASASSWQAAIGIDGWLARAKISGRPTAPAEGRDGVATALYVDLSLRLAARLTAALSLTASVALGAPLHEVELLDGAGRVGGLDGPRLAAAFGASWNFR